MPGIYLYIHSYIFRGLKYNYVSILSFFKVSVSLMCPESVPTVSFVSRCPSNAKEWKSASFRKRCDDVGKIQKCTKAENFVYHCVLNDEATALLEVCAPLYFISGKYNQ